MNVGQKAPTLLLQAASRRNPSRSLSRATATQSVVAWAVADRKDCHKAGCQQNICINIHMACSLHGCLKPGRIEIALAGVSETLDLITRASMQQLRVLRAQHRPRLRTAIEECGFTYKLKSIHKYSELPSKPMLDSDRPLLVMRG